jgi:2-(1,2-epoxy-1,2-dihydrophenyl)acetyl-CoA isomerase
VSGQIRVETIGVVTLVTMDAPERRNAISAEMREALVAALDAAVSDDECRAIVLTGAGGQFCAGFDIGEMADADEASLDDLRRRLERLHAIVRRLATGGKPVIAAVEGVAAGAGLSFACACDGVVAGEGASFVASWGKLALAADCGALWTLPRRVSYGTARDMMFSGRRVGLDEAIEVGLVDWRAPTGGAVNAAVSRATSYAACGPLVIAQVKPALARLASASLDTALEEEIALQGNLKLSEDHQEARRAFAEKRAPRFCGR